MTSSILKRVMPRVVKQTVKQLVFKSAGGFYTGPYKTWQQALKHSHGYDNHIILKHSEAALGKSLIEDKGFERDGVWVTNQDYAYPLLSYFAKSALTQKGTLRVIDYGGGLGSSYYQAKRFFNGSIHLDWQIVEQPHIVEAANNLNLDNGLHFCESLEECRIEGTQLLLLSGVLQYLEDPYHLMRQLQSYGFKTWILDRIPLIDGAANKLMVQHVPKQMYEASYPSWLFAEKSWVETLERFATIADSFNAIDGHYADLKLDIQFGGYILNL